MDIKGQAHRGQRNSEIEHHRRMSITGRRGTLTDRQLGEMHVPVRWRWLATHCYFLGLQEQQYQEL